jgi:hypothetical protein
MHLAELRRTDRWRLYYPSQDAFDEAMRNAEIDAEQWKNLAYEGKPYTEAAE